MINAHATLWCDHPGCRASLTLLEPLAFGQLNPRQLAEVKAAAELAGWSGRWIEPDDPKESAYIAHYCPEHATAAAMVAGLADRMKGGG